MLDEQVVYDNLSRRVLSYPAGAIDKPLIIILHSYTTTVDKMATLVGINKLTGFNIVLPQAEKDEFDLVRWNDSPLPGYATAVDDVGFIAYVIARAKMAMSTSDKVFLVGHSNGSFMIHRYLHQLGGWGIAGAAMVAGALLNTYTTDMRWHINEAVPTMMFNGTADTRVAYNGSMGVQSVPDTAEYYAAVNGYDRFPYSTKMPNKDIWDATTTTRHVYGLNSVLYTIERGGHTWPGSAYNPVNLGKTSQDIDASVLIKEFFVGLV